MKKLLLIVVLLGTVSAGLAQDAGSLPPGKWWRNQRLVQHLALTEEQQSRLDAIFRENASDLIDLKAEVEKRGLALRQEMDQAQVNRQNIQRAADNLTQARGRLFQRELMMFVDMRSVLSGDQWGRFRRMLEARGNVRRDSLKRAPGRDQRRPPSPKTP